jgi:hypothetical protein
MIVFLGLSHEETYFASWKPLLKYKIRIQIQIQIQILNLIIQVENPDPYQDVRDP